MLASILAQIGQTDVQSVQALTVHAAHQQPQLNLPPGFRVLLLKPGWLLHMTQAPGPSLVQLDGMQLWLAA